MNRRTHVSLHHVAPIHNVEKLILTQYVPACKETLECPQPVDPNVLLVQTAVKTKPVLIRNVLTHVLELVAQMQDVKF